MGSPDLSTLSDLAGRYRTRGLLLDANLLVLYVVGLYDQRLIRSHGSTRGPGFQRRDYRLLASFAESFDRLVTTPHVLTEVNGLLNLENLKGHRWGVLATFSTVISEHVEDATPSTTATADPAFPLLGLTDAAIMAAADGPLVASIDRPLCNMLRSRGTEALYFGLPS